MLKSGVKVKGTSEAKSKAAKGVFTMAVDGEEVELY